MTISESLAVINSYPIPEGQLEKVCLLRDLVAAEDFTKAVGESDSYELATADTYFYLSGHPSIVEQEVGINNAISIKERFFNLANAIYEKHNDPKYSGDTHGFIGENWNG